jgi:branched-chain amino acid transport system substrate-binding protein
MPDSNTQVTRRRTVLKYTGIGALLGVAGCTDGGGNGDADDGDGGTTVGTAQQQVDTVKIGSNHPLSGPVSFNGQIAHNAVKLALDKKNEAGGIESLGGADLELVRGDNQGEQELGGQVAEELINDGCVVQTGCIVSPVTTAATSVTERNQIPFVISVSSDRDILTGRGLNYAYRPQRHQYGQAIDYANMVPELIRENGGKIETAGLLYVNNAFGQESAQGLKDELPKKDVEVIEEATFPFGPSDLSTQVTKLKEADPDAVVISSYLPGGQLMAQAMKDQDYRPKYLTSVATTTFSDESAVEEVGEFANGITNNTAGLNATIDRPEQVAADFNDETGNAFNVVAALSFTTGEVIANAIEQAGSDDPEEINQAIQNLRYEDHILAQGPIEFQDNGENPNALAPLLQIQDTAPHVVYPEEFAARSFDLEALRSQ